MITSESTKEISSALRSAQNAVVAPLKNRTAKAGSYSYNYADLGDIIDSLRPVLNEYGLCFVQDVSEADGGVRISTRILHTSGEWLEFGPLLLPAGNTPQAFGSAITYGRRYQLTAAFGITAEDDDDGAAAKPARQRASGAPSSASASLPVSSAGGAPEDTSGTGAGEAGTAPEGYGEGPDGAVPATDELATADDLANAAKHGLTPTKAKALAKGLGFEWPPTREQLVAVIERYLEVKK